MAYEKFDIDESNQVAVKNNRRKRVLLLLALLLLLTLVIVAITVPSVVLTRSSEETDTIQLTTNAPINTSSTELSSKSTVRTTLGPSSNLSTIHSTAVSTSSSVHNTTVSTSSSVHNTTVSISSTNSPVSNTASNTTSISSQYTEGPTGVTTSTVLTTTITRTCNPACMSTQQCINGVSINTGNLAITLLWSVPGDGDLVVTTPNNKTIYHENPNATLATDYGALDVDDERDLGPESIYWDSAVQSPPAGTYHICFQQFKFDPPFLPVTIRATVEIRISGRETQLFSKSFPRQVSVLPNWCSPTLVTHLTSFNFP